MVDHSKLGPWVRRFLLEHVVAERNLSKNTQRSYRDTLALLLPFAAKDLHKQVDQLLIEHLTVELVRSFLQHLEEVRSCCVATRNQRLAAVHAFACFSIFDTRLFDVSLKPVDCAICARICVDIFVDNESDFCGRSPGYVHGLRSCLGQSTSRAINETLL